MSHEIVRNLTDEEQEIINSGFQATEDVVTEANKRIEELHQFCQTNGLSFLCAITTSHIPNKETKESKYHTVTGGIIAGASAPNFIHLAGFVLREQIESPIKLMTSIMPMHSGSNDDEHNAYAFRL